MKIKAKRWFAAVLAVVLLVSSTVVGFAATSLSSLSGLSKMLAPFDDGNGNFVLPYDPSTVPASYRDNFDLFASRLDEPDKYGLVFRFVNGSNFFTVYSYDRADFRLSKESFRHWKATSSGTTEKTCDSHYYVSSSIAPIISVVFTLDTSRGTFKVTSTGTASKLAIFCTLYVTTTSDYYDKAFTGVHFYVPDIDKIPTSPSTASFPRQLDIPGKLNLRDINAPLPDLHTLTIKYLYAADNPAADPAVRSLAAGTEYSIPSPEVAGYTPDKPLVSGIMPDDDLTIDVYYGRGFWPLTVRYQYADGTQALDDVVYQYPAGFNYQIPTPELAGYKPDKEEIAGEMPAEAVEAVVTYTAIPYTLTVAYRFTDGSLAAESHQEQLTVGVRYYVTSPQLEGYRPNQTAVSGVMPASDVTHTVTYRDTSGGGGGDDPFGGTEVPPYTGKDPFVISGLPPYTYDPFIIPGLPQYSYDPFVMPDTLK